MKKTIAILLLLAALVIPGPGALAEAVDLDLSAMPAPIAYAQALSMQQESEAYLGQRVRVSGIFNYSEARQRGVVIIADRSGCCETSLDFACAGEVRYPGDYPELYARLTVVGVFTRCEDGGNAYELTDAVIE